MTQTYTTNTNDLALATDEHIHKLGKEIARNEHRARSLAADVRLAIAFEARNKRIVNTIERLAVSLTTPFKQDAE